MSLNSQRIVWFTVFLVLILSAFFVPFLPFFRNLPGLFGAFLFWNAFAVIVIILLGVITARWRDNE